MAVWIPAGAHDLLRHTLSEYLLGRVAFTYGTDQVPGPKSYFSYQDLFSVLRNPHQVEMNRIGLYVTPYDSLSCADHNGERLKPPPKGGVLGLSPNEIINDIKSIY